MKARQLTILALAAIMVTSTLGVVAADQWHGGSGVFEPSTSYDTKDYMFQGPNQAPVDKVYLNGFIVESRFPSTVVQLDGGSIAGHSTDIYFGAMLGFWRDCNKDGYIGDKNVPASYGNWVSGAYPADASADSPVDRSICPVGGSYNSGLFVDEFRWIGPKAGAQTPAFCDPAKYQIAGCVTGSIQRDGNDVSDELAFVWADFGQPDSRGGRGEAIMARGTLDDSSSTLDRVDRVAGVSTLLGRVDPSLQEAYEGKPNFGECGEEREFLGGPEGQCGLYPLWQAKRLLNDSDSRDEPATPLVQVYDTEKDDDQGASGNKGPCDDTKLPGGSQMADPSPGIVADPLMDGSIGGTIVNIREGTGNTKLNGECGGFSAPNLEHDREITEGKDALSAELTFQASKRFTGLSAVGVGSVPMDGLGLTGGPNSPWDSPYGGLSGGAKWLSYTHYLATPPVTGAPIWTTMFADVSPEAFTNSGASPTTGLPAGAQDAHEYGHLQCGGNYDDTEQNRQPNAYNWICSQAVWDAARNADSTAWTNIIIGQKFDLRDADCYDATVMEVDGVGRVGAPAIAMQGLDGSNIRDTCGATILG